jgi:glycosyltransferase involved in cell wall biosynthesis
MACGVPCVVTDVGDAARMVEGVGVVVRRGSPEELRAAIEDLACRPAAELAELGLAARKRALERYSVERMVDDYAALMHELVRT